MVLYSGFIICFKGSLQNKVKFDMIDHPDELKADWINRDKVRISQKLFLYSDNRVVGINHFSQGKDQNSRNCYFNIYLDPKFNQLENFQRLYDEMLVRIKVFDCNRLFPWAWDHDNYKNYIKFDINIYKSI